MTTDHPQQTRERHSTEDGEQRFDDTPFESVASVTAKRRTVPYYTGTLAGIVMATIATVTIESSDAIWGLAEQAFVHHWIAKSLLTIGAFVVYHITGERPMDHRRWCVAIVLVALLGGLAISWVFVFTFL